MSDQLSTSVAQRLRSRVHRSSPLITGLYANRTRSSGYGALSRSVSAPSTTRSSAGTTSQHNPAVHTPLHSLPPPPIVATVVEGKESDIHVATGAKSDTPLDASTTRRQIHLTPVAESPSVASHSPPLPLPTDASQICYTQQLLQWTLHRGIGIIYPSCDILCVCVLV